MATHFGSTISTFRGAQGGSTPFHASLGFSPAIARQASSDGGGGSHGKVTRPSLLTLQPRVSLARAGSHMPQASRIPCYLAASVTNSVIESAM